MIRLVETATSSLSRRQAFGLVGDFANVYKWDPGVSSAEKVGDEPTGVGTAYDLVVEYSGRRLEMRYVITEYVPDRRVVLEGSGPRIHALDVIEFEDRNDGTKITYTADLSLTGIARFFEPLIKGRLLEVGEGAGIGLRRWLKELEVVGGKSSR